MHSGQDRPQIKSNVSIVMGSQGLLAYHQKTKRKE
jgi:hypothetical protein